MNGIEKINQELLFSLFQIHKNKQIFKVENSKNKKKVLHMHRLTAELIGHLYDYQA